MFSKVLSFYRAARGIDTPQQPARVSARLRCFLYSCMRPRLTSAWLACLAQPEVAPVFKLRPRLALKVHRPLISVAWSPAERFAVLRAHYGRMRRCFSEVILSNIYGLGVDLLHIVNTTTNRRLAARLLCSGQLEREGELTMCLADVESGLPLAQITFCVAGDENGAARLYIGGLQACRDERMRGIIHDIAKEMHGLRAKALVLWCVQQLAAHWRIGAIYAVDDAHHVSNYRQKRGRVFASYDDFWAESEGEHDSKAGFWKIPLQPRERGREELKPSRRKQHERRYAFLNDLRVSLLEAFARCAPGAGEGTFSGPVSHFYASPEKIAPSVVAAGAAALTREDGVTMAGLA